MVLFSLAFLSRRERGVVNEKVGCYAMVVVLSSSAWNMMKSLSLEHDLMLVV